MCDLLNRSNSWWVFTTPKASHALLEISDTFRLVALDVLFKLLFGELVFIIQKLLFVFVEFIMKLRKAVVVS